MNNFCVVCGNDIPEGRMVCPSCEKKVLEQSEKIVVVQKRKRRKAEDGTLEKKNV